MRARQEAGNCLDRANLIQRTAIDALAGFQDVAANNACFGFLEGRLERLARHFARLFFGADERSLGLFAGFAHSGLTLQLLGHRVGGGKICADQFLDFFQFGRVIFGFEVERFLGGLFGQVDDRIDHRLDRFMTRHDSAEHDFFGQFISFRFHHHHGVGGAGHDEVQFGLFEFFDRRVDDVLTILVAHARCADRAHEGRAGQDKRRRGTDHADHVRIVFEIIGHRGQHDLDFVLEAFDEKRADRAVDQARRQRLFLGRAAFTLEEATWDAARCVVFFHVVDGQGEEVLARLRAFRKTCGREHFCIAIGHHDGAIGLAGHLARFDRQRAAGPFQRHRFLVKHQNVFLFHIRKARRGPIARRA